MGMRKMTSPVRAQRPSSACLRGRGKRRENWFRLIFEVRDTVRRPPDLPQPPRAFQALVADGSPHEYRLYHFGRPALGKTCISTSVMIALTIEATEILRIES